VVGGAEDFHAYALRHPGVIGIASGENLSQVTPVGKYTVLYCADFIHKDKDKIYLFRMDSVFDKMPDTYGKSKKKKHKQ
jgi:hypothetical protein